MKVSFRAKLTETGFALSKWAKHELNKLRKGEVWFTVDDRAPKRSTRQNNLMWAWVEILGDSFGYTKDEMHQVLKQMFLKPRDIVRPSGRTFTVYPSTANLSKSDFVEYLQKIEQFAAEQGIALPDPSEWSLPTYAGVEDVVE